ncbi:uncharacterized protein LOC116652647 [Coturnix japonica]|uniref:uncharacterized protein LOC116652647 n=1 Tax=Coturnix japonica TaxID=93934 RepID=UPI0013A5D45F|nr:uncharacterized protein LOC116652647 [Coturnix japonica]
MGTDRISLMGLGNKPMSLMGLGLTASISLMGLGEGWGLNPHHLWAGDRAHINLWGWDQTQVTYGAGRGTADRTHITYGAGIKPTSLMGLGSNPHHLWGWGLGWERDGAMGIEPISTYGAEPMSLMGQDANPSHFWVWTSSLMGQAPSMPPTRRSRCRPVPISLMGLGTNSTSLMGLGTEHRSLMGLGEGWGLNPDHLWGWGPKSISTYGAEPRSLMGLGLTGTSLMGWEQDGDRTHINLWAEPRSLMGLGEGWGPNPSHLWGWEPSLMGLEEGWGLTGSHLWGWERMGTKPRSLMGQGLNPCHYGPNPGHLWGWD